MFFKTYASGMLEVNTYLIAGDDRRAVVIDPARADKLLDILKENDLTLTDILLTHGHFDHISAVKQLREATGARVCIHPNDAKALVTPNQNLMHIMHVDAIQGEADELVEEGPLEAGGFDFTVLHTPGHSAGSVCYLVNDVLFSGDTLFYRDIGRCDLPGSDFAVMKTSIERLLALHEDTKVYPGHSRATTIGEEKRAGVVMDYFR